MALWALSGSAPPPGPGTSGGAGSPTAEKHPPAAIDQSETPVVAHKPGVDHIPVKPKAEPPAPQLTDDLRKAILASPALAVQADSADPTQNAFAPTGQMDLLESSATSEGWKELRVKCGVIRRDLGRESKESVVVLVKVDLSGKLSSVSTLGAHDDQWDALLRK